MTTFVRDKQSYLTLFNVINLFGIHTGLKINHDKTESLLLGNLKESASSLELDDRRVAEVFRRVFVLTGIFIKGVIKYQGQEGGSVSRVNIGRLITTSVTSRHTSMFFKMASNFLVRHFCKR